MGVVDLSSLPNVDDDLVAFIDGVCERLEFDHGSYASLDLPNDNVYGFANYPDQWKEHYILHGYHRIDPTLHAAARSIAPVDWRSFRRDENFAAVFQDAGSFGITSRGVTVPVRGPYGDCGLFSVTRNCDQSEWETLRAATIGELQMVAVHFHDAVMRSAAVTRALYKPKLSQREIEVMQWIAAGKTQQDVGDILTISYRTVEVHLRSARDKLGALSTAQAIGRAIRMGLVHPS